MSPILKEIKEAFDKKRKWNAEWFKFDPPCNLHPFFIQDDWMHDYLFPEVLLFNSEDDWDIRACKICSEEQVLRIMAEHGLL